MHALIVKNLILGLKGTGFILT